jgi:molybdopterin synthase catalytic subunit
VHRVVLAHRIGTLQIGDIAVVTAVSSAHRHVAFAACRHAIERVKAVVPIWKKEFSEDGEAWVEGVHTEGVTGERRKADVEENAHG